MIIEQRIHNVKPGMVRPFLELLQSRELHLWSEADHRRLLGYFYTEVGGLNRIMALRAYRNFEERDEVISAMHRHAELADLGRELAEMTVSMENQLLRPAPFFKMPEL